MPFKVVVTFQLPYITFYQPHYQVDCDLWARLANMLKIIGFATMPELIKLVIIRAYKNRVVNVVTHLYDSYVIYRWKTYFEPGA